MNPATAASTTLIGGVNTHNNNNDDNNNNGAAAVAIGIKGHHNVDPTNLVGGAIEGGGNGGGRQHHQTHQHQQQQQHSASTALEMASMSKLEPRHSGGGDEEWMLDERMRRLLLDLQRHWLTEHQQARERLLVELTEKVKKQTRCQESRSGSRV